MKIYFILLILTLITGAAYAKPLKCKDLSSCVNHVSKITGKKYIYITKLKGAIGKTPNFKIDKDNADKYVSLILNQNGYTRIPLGDNEFQIIQARDVRYTATKIYNSEKDTIPDNYDYIMVSIQLTNPGLSTEITRSFRPFMSRYGRIIDIKSSGTIIIQDTAKNISRLKKLITKVDVKPTRDMLERLESKQKHRRALEKIKAQSCKGVKDDLEILRKHITKK
jgi:general secretion pathway protein D